MPNALLRRLCHSRASCSHLLGLATAAQAAPRRRPKHGAATATSCQGSRYHGDAFPTVSSPQDFPPLPPSWPGSSSTSQPGMRVRRSSCGDLSPAGPRQVANLFLSRSLVSHSLLHISSSTVAFSCVFSLIWLIHPFFHFYSSRDSLSHPDYSNLFPSYISSLFGGFGQQPQQNEADDKTTQ